MDNPSLDIGKIAATIGINPGDEKLELDKNEKPVDPKETIPKNKAVPVKTVSINSKDNADQKSKLAIPSLDDFKKELDPETKPDENKEEAKEFQLGGKHLSKSEMTEKLNEHFKNKYDFSGIDDETFRAYADLYTKAFDGQRKEDWQKSLGTRENELAKERKMFLSEKKAFEDEKKSLSQITSVSDEDIEDDYNLSLAEKQRKITQKIQAESRLSELEGEEERIASEENAILFAELHYKLAGKYPELATTIDIRDVFRKHNSKQEVSQDDVKVAYTVYKILNDAHDYGFNDPVEFYNLYGATYKTNLNGIVKEDHSGLIDKATKLKEKQDKVPVNPPGSMPVNPNQSSRADVIPGNSENEKLNAILMNKK